jgi:arylsulfatase A-like enzyme
MPAPNVVLILADDLGFSDVGCYGGEIQTPNIDRLAQGGVRFSQFYNTARCSPSRASLLTGLHPHQTGIGVLTNDDRPRGYPGTINRRCVTLAEVLQGAGYATGITGKWHLATEMRVPNDAWPTRRGFDYFFGTLTGCGSYFDPGTLTRGEDNIEDEPRQGDFYYTDAIAGEASAFIRRHGSAHPDQPFLLYVPFTAPHWPLHAREEDVAKYRGRFAAGWDRLREARMQRLLELGILQCGSAELSGRDPTQPPWATVEDKAWQQRRMEVYAAQVDRMDQGIGRILEALDDGGHRSNTLVIFHSDNGGSDEGLPLHGKMEQFKQRSDIVRLRTRDGREVHIGNEPSVMPGPEDTYSSYGRAWANLSNTPFRYYKRWVHEGGIATPFVVHWPDGSLPAGRIVHAPAQLTDVMPTLVEATGSAYPTHYDGHEILPMEGRSLVAMMRGGTAAERSLFWEHTGNAAIRTGDWKLVRDWPRPWELYDLSRDRSEIHDVADRHPERVRRMSADWDTWARRAGVIPWEATLTLYLERGQTQEDAWA